ncbi:MAG: hypothetical protein NTX76_00120 [Alphaproteobacteria bacterium]|nr:hypothetical protein [Alphaproteobacteria bacterium]
MLKKYLFIVYGIFVSLQHCDASNNNAFDLDIDSNVSHSAMTTHRQLKAIKYLSIEQKIANFINGTLQQMTNKDVCGRMAKHFRQMKLLDQQDKWAPGLEGIAKKLFPENVTVSDFETLVDQMAVCAARNPYLHSVVEEVVNGNLGDLYSKAEQEGKEILPDVVAYAMVLNNLTVAMRNDIAILKICSDIWIEERSKIDIFSSTFGLFEWIKFFTIEKSIDSFRAVKNTKLAPNYGKCGIPINILEATLTDIFNGNFNNAYAGCVLAKNSLGGKENEVTGAGPATFSEDRRAISIHMPFEKKWADLYAVWNLGFVSRYEAFPYVMVKLLIPQVSDYEKAPGEYIYNRTLALYATLNFMCFGDPEIKCDVHLKSFNWKQQELTDIFGKINVESAKEYQAEVDKADAIFKKSS